MASKVSALIGAQLVVAIVAVAAMISLAEVPIEPAPVTFVVYTVVLVVLLQLPPIYVELRRHGGSISLTDGAYTVGLVVLGPIGFVIAVGLAEVISGLWTTQPLLKRLFNLSSLTVGAAVGALAYTLAGGSEPLELRTWIATGLALLTISLWDTLMTALVLAISEREPLRGTIAEIGPPQAIALGVSIPIGWIALVLLGWEPLSLLLLAPILVLVHVSARAALRQQADRQRIQGLADASADVVELVGTQDLLTRIARQSRELVTAATAVAIAAAEDGTVVARAVDDGGADDVDPELLAALFEIVGELSVSRRGELAISELDPSIRALFPISSSLLWVTHRSDGADALLVAAFREFWPDGGDAHRADVLATFVAHAATAFTNVRLHAELQENLAQARALSQKKDEFVATVSHELRTPLTSIGGAIETLQHRGDLLPVEDRARLLDLASDHSGRLRGLIDDLLLVAEGAVHRAEVRTDPADVIGLVDGLEQQFRPWMSDQLHIRLQLTDRWFAVDGDKIRRILAHLLDNARKYAAGAIVELEVTQRPSTLEFVVRDGGPGIDARARDDVFGPFVQLDSSLTRERGGLGIGLHLCRQLSESLGGEIDIDTDPLGGARFTVSVPALPASPRTAEQRG